MTRVFWIFLSFPFKVYGMCTDIVYTWRVQQNNDYINTVNMHKSHNLIGTTKVSKNDQVKKAQNKLMNDAQHQV